MKRPLSMFLLLVLLSTAQVVTSLPGHGRDAKASESEWECDSSEIVSERTRDSRTELNPDCTYSTTFGRYMHYEAQPGEWEKVDLNFYQNGPDWVADHHDVVIKVTGASVVATERATGQGVRWITPAAPAVQDRRASFTDQGLEWSYYTTKPGLKLVAIVPDSRGAQTYTFPYSLVGGASDFEEDAEGNLVSERFSVPRAVVLGADGVSYDAGEWEILTGNRVAFDFDDSGLPPAAFPYELDPPVTFNVAVGAADGDVIGYGAGYPPPFYSASSTGEQVFLQRAQYQTNQYTVTNGLMRWDTSTLPDDVAIDSATVRLGSTGQTGNQTSERISAEWYGSWPIDSADYQPHAQTSAANGVTIADAVDDYVGDGYFDIPLDNVNGISKGGYTGLRLHITGGQVALGQQQGMSYRTYESTARVEPQLIITFGPDELTRESNPGSSPGDPVETLVTVADLQPTTLRCTDVGHDVAWKNGLGNVAARIEMDVHWCWESGKIKFVDYSESDWTAWWFRNIHGGSLVDRPNGDWAVDPCSVTLNGKCKEATIRHYWRMESQIFLGRSLGFAPVVYYPWIEIKVRVGGGYSRRDGDGGCEFPIGQYAPC